MTGPAAKPVQPSLLPLFLVSAAAVGYEIALTRYFAVAKWSEYGYWVISIVMVGFALSGVAMALGRDWAVRRGPALLAALPAVLVLAAAGGYWATTAIPFNPLQLQNAATMEPQLWNIAAYYAVLLPFFFLTGLFISLSFVLNEARIGRVYGFDLAGAGLGAAGVLALMWALHPFALVPALLPVLAAATLRGPGRLRAGIAAAVALLAGEALVIGGSQAAYNDFKAIYAPLNVPDGRQVAELRTPRGLYAVLDDFTEVLDTDVSNNADMLGVPAPPKPLLGVYRDGNRVAALPRPGQDGAAYAPAALDALPYVLRPGARVLLGGSSGGFRIRQALVLGAAHVDALEPDPVLLGALRNGLGLAPALPADPRVRLLPDGPLAAARGVAGRYDVVDLSGDFLDAGEANATAYTAEAMRAYLAALAPGGVVSLPVSIREFPVYAMRVLATARRALLAAGAADPARHVVAYRSAWNVRVLLSNEPWDEARLAIVRRFADERSFDVSFDPGRPAGERPAVYNDLPAVSFTSGEVTASGDGQDAIADEAGPVLRGERVPSADAFNLRPITLDRPSFYSVLRLDQVGAILPRLELLPQAEIGQFVNLAVLAQAAVIALVVLLLPLAAPRVAGTRAGRSVLRPAVYFASLGLGFLFIEIVLIEKASLYLNDRTSAFALVLTGMLVCGGAGSLLAERVGRAGLLPAAAVVLGWCVLALFALEPAMLATLGLPWAVRAALLLVAIAPVSVALGLPFPLGLARAGEAGGGFLPWAWALNGAFSVVATPLANLLAVQQGFDRVLMLAGLLYVVVFLAYPSVRKSTQWQPSPIT